MYFRLISGNKAEGELTKEEQHRVDNVIKDVIENFLLTKHRFNCDEDKVIKSHNQDEGYIYTTSTKIGEKQHLFEYFVSSFEFGPPRKDIHDNRFDFQWKETMIEYIKKFAPEYLEQYLQDWAKVYREHRNRVREKLPVVMLEDFDKATEKSCSTANYIDDSSLGLN